MKNYVTDPLWVGRYQFKSAKKIQHDPRGTNPVFYEINRRKTSRFSTVENGKLYNQSINVYLIGTFNQWAYMRKPCFHFQDVADTFEGLD
jgi:hypothetical protein